MRACTAVLTAACACVTALCADVGSSVASTCPAVTTCPTDTAIDAIVPDVENFSLAVVAAARLPDAEIVAFTSPVATVAVRTVPVDPAEAVDGWSAYQVPPPTRASTPTSALLIMRRLRRVMHTTLARGSMPTAR